MATHSANFSSLSFLLRFFLFFLCRSTLSKPSLSSLERACCRFFLCFLLFGSACRARRSRIALNICGDTTMAAATGDEDEEDEEASATLRLVSPIPREAEEAPL